jgi:predicted DNA-binding transcriptional regulator YafY
MQTFLSEGRDGEAGVERVSKIWRTLKVFTLIVGHPGIGARELAERCEVSLRTIYRDVDLLKIAGIPIFYDRGYRITENFFLSPIQFTLQEVVSLIMGAEVLSRQKGSPFEKGVEGALEKIYAVLPPGLGEAARKESSRFAPAHEPTVDYRERLPLLETLERCCGDGHSVRIIYRSFSRGETTSRVVDPYGFIFRSNAWYLVGHCHLRGEIKIFKFDRILEAKRLERTFQMPEEFSLKEYIGDAWQVVRGEPHRVSVKFSPRIAPYVKESIWHPSQRCIDLEDGSCILTFSVGSISEIATWINDFGGEAEVLEPQELRELLLQRASEIVRLYSGR